MRKQILWIDDNNDIFNSMITDYFTDRNINIVHVDNLLDAIYELESNVNLIKYDGIIVDLQLPLPIYVCREDIEYKYNKYIDSQGWNGYLLLVNNINTLNEKGIKFAINTGFPAELIKKRLTSDGIRNNDIIIFQKSDNGLLEKITNWIEKIKNINNKNPLFNYELLWIDDEYLPPRIIDDLKDKGININHYTSVRQFIHDYNQMILANKSSNYLDNKIILMDVVLRDDSGTLSGTRDGEQTGIALTREIIKKYPHQKIIGCSSWSDSKTKNWFWEHCYGFLTKESEHLSNDIIKRLQEILLKKRLPKTFIVHGWDLELRNDLRNHLVNDLHFPEPIILDKTSSVGKTIIEKIEEATIGVDLVFVLCTPDDTVIMPDGNTYKQARPNVLIELGYFYGRLGRLSGKIIVIIKDKLNIPSDISGVTYIPINNNISEAYSTIKTELKALNLID